MSHRRLASRAAAALLFAALPLAACQTSGSGGSAGSDWSASSDAPAGTVWQGEHSRATARAQIVARSAQEWADLWAKVGEAPPVSLPADRLAVAVFLGPRDTAGFAVAITRAQTVAGALRVGYRERVPGPADTVALAQTSPYAIRLLPRVDGAVAFQRDK